jgi:hypothetical protein
METLIIYIAIGSCITSALFVMIRTYFCYFAKRNCSSDCKCNAAKTDNTVCRDIIYGEVFKGDKQKDLADAVTAAVGVEVVEAIGAAVKTNPKRPGAYKRPKSHKVINEATAEQKTKRSRQKKS